MTTTSALSDPRVTGRQTWAIMASSQPRISMLSEEDIQALNRLVATAAADPNFPIEEEARAVLSNRVTVIYHEATTASDGEPRAHDMEDPIREFNAQARDQQASAAAVVGAYFSVVDAANRALHRSQTLANPSTASA